MKLKLSDITQITIIIGAIAFVISLIFVGLQARETSRPTASSANDSRSGWHATVGNNQKASTLKNKYFADFDSLSNEEQLHLIANQLGVPRSHKTFYNY